VAGSALGNPSAEPRRTKEREKDMATATKRAATKEHKGSPPTSQDLTAHPDVRALLGDSFLSVYESTMTIMEWGEDLIETMGRTHPEHADRIWHSFMLLKPTDKLMGTEAVYRSHCTEIIERVIAHEDTRPGTAAECCIACCVTSQIAPLTAAGTGLYLRLWEKAGLPALDGVSREPYEAIRGEVIDDHERELRGKLKQDWRTLPKVIEHKTGCPEMKARQAAIEQPGDTDT
jgi:hypothetical protein